VFRTSDHARHPVLSALAGPGGHVWRYANLTHEKVWFYASYEVQKTETSAWPETILLSSVDQVKELYNGFQGVIDDVKLMLVSPGSVNRTAAWKMDPLSEIWCGRDPESQDNVFVYGLVDGRRYIDSHRVVDCSELLDLERIVSTAQ
jgi:hypothetical protein